MSNITDLKVSVSLVVTIILSTASGVYWASNNLVLAADVERSHLEIRLETEQQSNTDKIERYRRELRYQTDQQIKEDIKADISNARARNLDIKKSLYDLEAGK